MEGITYDVVDEDVLECVLVVEMGVVVVDVLVLEVEDELGDEVVRGVDDEVVVVVGVDDTSEVELDV